MTSQPQQTPEPRRGDRPRGSITMHPLMPGSATPRGVEPDPTLIRLLRQSFAEMAGHGELLAILFYENLFQTRPELRAMFPREMAGQRRKLLDTLAIVIEGLQNPAGAKDRLGALGDRHIGYGVKPEHYPVVCECLLAAMRRVSGVGWTGELETEWKRALALMSSIMQRSAATGSAGR